MDTSKKSNEGEMGSGDSDDEFYNVKLPTAPVVTSNKPYKKPEVKKIYSPPKTKVQYDYRFDSSSDEESDNKSSQKEYKAATNADENNKCKKQTEKKEESVNEESKLSQNTFKVFEKINEELKNINQGAQGKAEMNESQVPTSIQGGVNIPRPPKSVIPPVVVVPPPMVVPQASIVGPMIVPSMGMRGPVMLPSQNLMMTPSAMGLAGNSMMGMSGMMGMQGNLMGVPGGMIMPAMGGLNMGLPGNMLRMPANPLLRMQRPRSNVMGISGPTSNLRSGTVPPPPPANLMVNNQVMANPGLMVMGGMMNDPLTSTNQTTPGNFMSNSMIRLVNTPQGSVPLRVPPPPPFLNFRGRPPAPPGNFRWTANSKMQSNLAKTGSPTSSSPGATSPESSPLYKSRDCDGEEFTDDKDKSSPHDTDESESPPRELPNTFKNDGSFMEMFKKMREESENSQETASNSEKAAGDSEANSSSAVKKPVVMISGIVGKRRGGRVLKTGLVKKLKKGGDAEEEHPKDAWSMYMAEVKKYREASCEEEGKTRPLVK